MTETSLRISYPEELPVSERREDIAAAIRDHQVVIVAGETGSGKTTQLPKICLELGRGSGHGRGMIGHTQPRRIAARSVAERIAEELGTELGDVVGYQVRFTDRTSKQSRVKLMTDGILLAELQRDRDLRRYDTIIIDEAHERASTSTSCSATSSGCCLAGPTSRSSSPARRSTSTASPSTSTPPSSRSPGGRTPSRSATARSSSCPEEDEEGEPVVRDQTEAILDAVRELSRRGAGRRPGVPARRARDPRHRRRVRTGGDRCGRGSRSSRSTPASARPTSTRSSPPHTVRRVVLATNVAETSLTVPGIRYVVDTGVARISRYSVRTKVQRLPIEPISQASANQRSGRCGRVGPGIAIRLYSEEDFEGRPEFTDPEILRTNLASVILQMASLRLGDIARVPLRRAARPAQRQGRHRPAGGARRRWTASASAGQAARRSASDWPGCRSTRGWAG